MVIVSLVKDEREPETVDPMKEEEELEEVVKEHGEQFNILILKELEDPTKTQ
jgi:hypothetical protein